MKDDSTHSRSQSLATGITLRDVSIVDKMKDNDAQMDYLTFQKVKNEVDKKEELKINTKTWYEIRNRMCLSPV